MLAYLDPALPSAYNPCLLDPDADPVLDEPLAVAEEDGVAVDTLGPPAFACARGAPRQSSLNAMDAKNKLGKKKPGLLKGIGSMFR